MKIDCNVLFFAYTYRKFKIKRENQTIIIIKGKYLFQT